MMPAVRWFETDVATCTSGSEPSCQPGGVSAAGPPTPTLEEELLGRLEEPHLPLGGGDGVEFSVAGKTVFGVIGVADRAQEGGEEGLLPDLGRCFVTEHSARPPV